MNGDINRVYLVARLEKPPIQNGDFYILQLAERTAGTLNCYLPKSKYDMMVGDFKGKDLFAISGYLRSVNNNLYVYIQNIENIYKK